MTALSQPEDAVRLVKENADIVTLIGEYVQLRRSGVNFKGLCPFHAEKTPSFMVHPERQTFHCFGCGEGGDVLSFVIKYHNLSFPEALQELAQRFNITLPERHLSGEEHARAKKRQALLDVNEQAAVFFHRFLLESKEAEGARNYLEKRGAPRELIESFRLGFAPERWDFLGKSLATSPQILEDAILAGLLVRKEQGGHYDRFRNRILFPIVNLTGHTVAFGGRIMGEGQPKYLNSPETPVFEKNKTLFGLYQNRESIRQARQCLVVEGNFDLLTMVAQGLKNVVAPLGTAITPSHIRTLKGYCDEVILLFDGDEAGVKAAARAVPLFLTERVTARVVTLPERHDPDTFLEEHGPAKLKELLAAAKSMPEFFFESLVRRHGLSIEGKSRIVAELAPLITAIGNDQMQRTVFVTHFSERLGIQPEQMMTGLKKSVTRRGLSQPTKPGDKKTSAPMSVKERQLLEFLIGYPEYVGRFLEAGVEEMLAGESAAIILTQLKAMVVGGGEVAPELLLRKVEGAERNFVSKVLFSVPDYSEEMREAIAMEALAWLGKEGLRVQRENLIRRISEAQQANDEASYMELMGKVREINNHSG